MFDATRARFSGPSQHDVLDQPFRLARHGPADDRLAQERSPKGARERFSAAPGMLCGVPGECLVEGVMAAIAIR